MRKHSIFLAINSRLYYLIYIYNMVTLRPLQQSDRNQLAILANNWNIWKNVRDQMPFPYTEDNADFFINHIANNNENQIRAIFYDSSFCGMIGLHRQKDIYRLSAELGYWIGEPFWGRGIATEATLQMTTFGFKHLHLNRIYAGVFSHNIASMRVLEKCGFEREGIFKNAVIKNNVILDEHRFAKLADDAT
jgi:[ribosomal protein S5]-alanine N-acetyltransferase